MLRYSPLSPSGGNHYLPSYQIERGGYSSLQAVAVSCPSFYEALSSVEVHVLHMRPQEDNEIP